MIARSWALIAVLYTFASTSVVADSTIEHAIRTAAESELQKPTVVGLSVAVGKGDQVVYAEGFGAANIETGEEVSASTKMRVGSVSKVFTTALLGKLYEGGKLDLDAPVETYVPAFPQKRWPVSLRQMAAHMGGIRHYRGDEFLNTHYYPTVTEGIEMFIHDPLIFEPGTQVQYSSHAWNLISAALEGAGGDSFLTMMDEQVFGEIGMQDTMAEDITKPLSDLSAFHVNDDGTPVIAPFVDNSYKWAGGGFIGTASDMVCFGLAHTKAGFLKQETLDLLFKEQHTNDSQPAGFGIGWMTAGNMRGRLKRDGLTDYLPVVHDHLVWHSGGSMGGVALLLVDTEHDIAVGLLANHGQAFPALMRVGLEALQAALASN
ncbi:serine hydrolase domain-containing protein [Kordiimonas sp.]|uniref:serine hydrolase domain-containing protein n=1 Tax=Kordiimonas sp. TaxID=1970157 RepID=UPI003A8E4159